MSHAPLPPISKLQLQEETILRLFGAVDDDLAAELVAGGDESYGSTISFSHQDRDTLLERTAELLDMARKIGLPEPSRGGLTTDAIGRVLSGSREPAKLTQYLKVEKDMVPAWRRAALIHQSAKQLDAVQESLSGADTISEFSTAFARATSNEDAEKINDLLSDALAKTTRCCGPKNYRMRGKLAEDYKRWLPQLDEALQKLDDAMYEDSGLSEYQEPIDTVRRAVGQMKAFTESYNTLMEIARGLS